MSENKTHLNRKTQGAFSVLNTNAKLHTRKSMKINVICTVVWYKKIPVKTSVTHWQLENQDQDKVTWAQRYLENLDRPSSCWPIRGKILKNLSTDATSPWWTAASNLLCTMSFSLVWASWSRRNDTSSVLPVGNKEKIFLNSYSIIHRT